MKACIKQACFLGMASEVSSCKDVEKRLTQSICYDIILPR